MDKITVGKFIAEQRKLNSLTQKQLAEKLDVTDKAVSRWETGKGYPDIETLEKISTVFGVTVNDILSGEILTPEKKEEKADENIIDAMKTTKRVKKKYKSISVIISIIAIILFVVSVYALVTVINKPESEHKSMELYSQNGAVVFYEIYEAVKQEFRVSDETISTYADIQYDGNGELTHIDMQLWDWHTSKNVQIKYWLHDETGLPQISLSYTQGEPKNEETDGILFDTYIEMLTSVDLVETVRKSGTDISNGFALNSDSWMFKTIDEDDKTEFGDKNYNYLYKNKELIALTSLELLSGKCHEISVRPIVYPSEETEHAVVSSCCLIYVPR